MSGYLVYKLWHMGKYKYVFYRYVLELLCAKFMNSLILDVGCGNHVSSLSAIPKASILIGVDINRANVMSSNNTAKKLNMHCSYLRASVTHLPFKSNTFPLCVSIDVLEHVDDKSTAIRELQRVTIPQGRFVGSTTNLMNPLGFLDAKMPQKFTAPLISKFSGPGHYERHDRLSPKKLNKLLEKDNFKHSMLFLGFPFFQPWLYEFQNQKIGLIANIWIVFDRITFIKPLKFLKEMIVFYADKS